MTNKTRIQTITLNDTVRQNEKCQKLIKERKLSKRINKLLKKNFSQENSDEIDNEVDEV